MYYFSKEVAPILKLNSGKGFEEAKKLLVGNDQPPSGLWDWIGIRPPRAALMQWDDTHCVLRIRVEPSWYYNGGRDWLSGLLRAQYCTNEWGEAVEGRRFFGFSPKGGGSWIFVFPNDKFKAEEVEEDIGESAHILAEREQFTPRQEEEQLGLEVEKPREPEVKAFIPKAIRRKK